jgi:hypothetical protein
MLCCGESSPAEHGLDEAGLFNEAVLFDVWAERDPGSMRELGRFSARILDGDGDLIWPGHVLHQAALTLLSAVCSHLDYFSWIETHWNPL